MENRRGSAKLSADRRPRRPHRRHRRSPPIRPGSGEPGTAYDGWMSLFRAAPVPGRRPTEPAANGKGRSVNWTGSAGRRLSLVVALVAAGAVLLLAPRTMIAFAEPSPSPGTGSGSTDV